MKKKNMKSLKFFIDYNDRKLKQYTSELIHTKKKIEDLFDKKEKTKDEIEKIQNHPIRDIASLNNTFEYIQAKKQLIAQIENEIDRLQKELGEIETKVKEHYSQKKGLEKLYQKNHNLWQYKQMNKERQIADESFIRKYLTR